MAIERREFLRAGRAWSAVRPPRSARCRAAGACSSTRRSTSRGPAACSSAGRSDSGIDHVVVVMMENRSFDHWLGWLADDQRVPRGGAAPLRAAVLRRRQAAPDDRRRPTVRSRPPTCSSSPARSNPYRGCDYDDPGHGWIHGRAQRDGGFLAPGSRNDMLRHRLLPGRRPAVHVEARPPVHDVRPVPRVAPRPDVPEPRVPALRPVRRHEDNDIPLATGGFPWETIWERLDRGDGAGAVLLLGPPGARALGHPDGRVPAPERRDYFTPTARRARCRTSRSSTRSSSAPSRNDDHPHADIRAGPGVRARRVRGVRRSPRTGATACSSSPTTSGAASSTTSRRRTSRTTARARSTSTTSARPASACRR